MTDNDPNAASEPPASTAGNPPPPGQPGDPWTVPGPPADPAGAWPPPGAPDASRAPNPPATPNEPAAPADPASAWPPPAAPGAASTSGASGAPGGAPNAPNPAGAWPPPPAPGAGGANVPAAAAAQPPAVGAGTGAYGGDPDPGDFDQLTRKVGGLTTRRKALGIGGAAILTGVLAWFLWGRGSSKCPTPSRCGDRHYCNEDETCICTESAEGDIRCGELPPYCNVPLCTTSADCAHLGDGWFCDTPDSGCCTDPPAELTRCIAPCGGEYPPAPTTTTIAAPDEPDEADGTDGDDDGEPTHLRPTATQVDDVQFFSRFEDGTTVHYAGEQTGGGIRPTHVMIENPDGTTAMLIFDDALLPISWTVANVSIAARSAERGVALDPTDALHAIVAGSEETVLQLDLVPGDLDEVIRWAEPVTGETFAEARAVIEETSGDWADLVRAAGTSGDTQPQAIANALAFSTLHAAAAMLIELGAIGDKYDDSGYGEHADRAGGSPSSSGADDDATTTTTPDDADGAAATTTTTTPDADASGDDETSSAPRGATGVPGAVPIAHRGPAAPSVAGFVPPGYKLLGELLGPLLESLVKNALLSLAAETLFGPEPPVDPPAPLLDLLLCQGATSWGNVCHYTYFDRRNIQGCVDFCKTDLSCYTNICMPITASAEQALKTMG